MSDVVVLAEGTDEDGPWRVELRTVQAVVLVAADSAGWPCVPVVTSDGGVEYADAAGVVRHRGLEHLAESAAEAEAEGYPGFAAFTRAIADQARKGMA